MFYSDFILYEDARSDPDRKQPRRINMPLRYLELSRHGIEQPVANPFLPMRKEVLLGRTKEILTLLEKQTNPEDSFERAAPTIRHRKVFKGITMFLKKEPEKSEQRITSPKSRSKARQYNSEADQKQLSASRNTTAFTERRSRRTSRVGVGLTQRQMSVGLTTSRVVRRNSSNMSTFAIHSKHLEPKRPPHEKDTKYVNLRNYYLQKYEGRQPMQLAQERIVNYEINPW